jgi:uncharacterized protein YndB with AHSA1/START domain
MNSTRINRQVKAPRTKVYSALVDADAIAKWKVPDGMTSHVHAFEGREGGKFRISCTYDAPTAVGKTTAHTDTYHGRFVKLVPNERVVEVVEFETADPRAARRDDDHDHARRRSRRHRAARRAPGTAARPVARRQRDRLANGPRKTRRAR